jgi:hypothetical protein
MLGNVFHKTMLSSTICSSSEAESSLKNTNHLSMATNDSVYSNFHPKIFCLINGSRLLCFPEVLLFIKTDMVITLIVGLSNNHYFERANYSAVLCPFNMITIANTIGRVEKSSE